MKFVIRHVESEDQVPIIDCDIKCFDYAWTTDEWAFAYSNYIIRVATSNGTPIGFVTYFYDDEAKQVQMLKLGVKPAYRRNGVGRSLLGEVISFAKQIDVPLIETLLPESVLRPGEPVYVGDWMLKNGWRAVGLVKEFFPAMGQREDAVKFHLNV